MAASKGTFPLINASQLILPNPTLHQDLHLSSATSKKICPCRWMTQPALLRQRGDGGKGFVCGHSGKDPQLIVPDLPMQVDGAASDGESDPSPVQGLVTSSSPAKQFNTAPSVDLSSPGPNHATPGYGPSAQLVILHDSTRNPHGQ